jgi:hypothetical protein
MVIARIDQVRILHRSLSGMLQKYSITGEAYHKIRWRVRKTVEVAAEDMITELGRAFSDRS